LWQESSKRQIAERIRRLTPERPRIWGRMSAQQMVCHLHRSIQMAIGEIAVAGRWTPFRLPIVKPIVLYYAPFPKNVPTAPELVVTDTPDAWERDVRRLDEVLDRFVARGRGAPWPDHPAFGRMSADQWGVLVYRHVDHHLRQFAS
jgi:hypothetical protein